MIVLALILFRCLLFQGRPLPGAADVVSGPLSSVALTLPSATVPFDEDSMLQLTANSANQFDGGNVQYFDGNPASGGTLIDIQNLPSLSPNTTDVERTYYRPLTCGARTLYAVSNAEGFPRRSGSYQPKSRWTQSRRFSR